ncbi:MAG: hypothetical protein GX219_10055 [Tissierellia bacterium]|nr:hypothetical protein [Tissierellia bacterium]
MRLELFDFIDETIEYLESRKEFVETIAQDLERFFYQNFSSKDYFLNVSKRVKSYSSLKEKILRNNLFIEYKTPDVLFENLSDLIGLRIECRFIEDEKKVYEDLLNLFTINTGDGYYTNSEVSSINLLMGETQPQVQKNGFEIYKFDGKYNYSDRSVNFELQIKSLVNEFWGEIDHRVLYKNFNYMLTEDFFHDIMISIKDNLSMIDRQLMIVYDHLSGVNYQKGKHKFSEIKSMTSKLVHDHYIQIIKEEVGFVIDFKKLTDLIVDYIYLKNQNVSDSDYGNYFIDLLNRFSKESDETISLTSHIEIGEIDYPNKFTKKVGTIIKEVINVDFKWNLFLRILFEIEDENNNESFLNFLCFIKKNIEDIILEAISDIDTDDNLKELILISVMDAIADSFSRNQDVEYLTESNIKPLAERVRLMLTGVRDEFDWFEVSVEVLSMVKHFSSI